MEHEILPNPDARKVYKLNYQIFRELYQLTAILMHKLAEAHLISQNNE
ncbi:MAG TPA: hypothetical protein G4N92_03525 [Anaerolineae bacterium]|nr:hypothetical protein [Anaerolineae bacterium]